MIRVLLFFVSTLRRESRPDWALIKIRPDGSRETVASEGLVNPYGVAIGRDGAVYVSNHGAEAGVGEVLRFERHH